METVRRAIARKRHSYINDKGKRQYAEVGDIIDVTPAQALAFADNLVAPEVLEAQVLAKKAVTEANAKANEAKNAAKQSLDNVRGDKPNVEVRKNLKKDEGKGKLPEGDKD